MPIHHYRVKRRCYWQHRLWTPDDHAPDGSVEIDTNSLGTPPHHFLPVDDGPVGDTPKHFRGFTRAAAPVEPEPNTLSETAKAAGQGEKPAAPAATNESMIANRAKSLQADLTRDELYEMAGPDGLEIDGAKKNMSAEKLATAIARHELELEPFPAD